MDRSVSLSDKLQNKVMKILDTNTTVKIMRVDENKCSIYGLNPWRTPKLTKKKMEPSDQSKANFRGFNDKTGNKKMHTM